MDKKIVITAVTSFVLGMGGMYLVNKNKIDFMNRYPMMLRTQKYMEKTIGIDRPERPSDEVQINAFLSLYDDKYTCYAAAQDPESKEYVTDQVNSSSAALGSGFEVDFNDSDEPFFSYVNEKGEAYKQGFREGDVIVSVDGEQIVEPKNIRKLIGEDGTTANIVVRRGGIEIPVKFTRASDLNAYCGVTTKMYGNVLYMRIEHIDDKIELPVKTALEENDFKKLIIDLRNNPGGNTMKAVSFADNFVTSGEVRQIRYDGDVEPLYTSDNVTCDVPLVVLVNGNTASAAEIITALFKQYGGATLVGEKTFGKGIFQLVGLFNRGELKYTYGYVEVGEWDCYHGIGIEPDVKVRMDEKYIGTENDTQLAKALEIISEK